MKRVLVKKELLESLYLDKKFSVSQIAEKLGYSQTGINYLFKKFLLLLIYQLYLYQKQVGKERLK